MQDLIEMCQNAQCFREVPLDKIEVNILDFLEYIGESPRPLKCVSLVIKKDSYGS